MLIRWYGITKVMLINQDDVTNLMLIKVAYPDGFEFLSFSEVNKYIWLTNVVDRSLV